MERRSNSSIHHLWALKQYFELLCTQHFPREIIYHIISFYYKLFRVSICCYATNFVMLFDTEVYTWTTKEDIDPRFKIAHSTIPTKLDIPPTTKIASGTGHVLALTQNQTVYVWGNNDYGQLGTNHVEPINDPTPHYWNDAFGKKILSDIIKIKTSEHRSIALSRSGKVYSWGDNYYKHVLQIVPPPIGYHPHQMNLPPIKKIACGACHSIVLTLPGEVYSWGSNNMRQLGNGMDSNKMRITYTPQKIYLPPVKNISCGHNFSMAITTDNEVYAWGSNEFGQLSLGSHKPFNIPKKIDLPNIKKISCGSCHTIAIITDNEIWGWGSNMNYSLNLDKEKYYDTPQKLNLPNAKNIKKIVCGIRVSIAITEMNDIYIWGGSYGKLGDKFMF
jgi:alpha-tubulin suppressor-like RCC1 family protein